VSFPPPSMPACPPGCLAAQLGSCALRPAALSGRLQGSPAGAWAGHPPCRLRRARRRRRRRRRSSIPDWIQWLHYLSLFYYAYSSLMINEVSDLLLDFVVRASRAAIGARGRSAESKRRVP
jgi:hypothetical protein